MRRTIQAALLTGVLAIGVGLGSGPSSAKAGDGYGGPGYGGYSGPGYGGYGGRGYGHGRGHGHGRHYCDHHRRYDCSCRPFPRPPVYGVSPYPSLPYGIGGGSIQYSESQYYESRTGYNDYPSPFPGQPW